MRINLQSAGKRSLRLDRPASPPADEPELSESTSWLDMLRNAIRSARKDQREDQRHPALEHEIWVGWWTDDHFGAISGHLQNISKGGALIVLGTKPPKNQPIWIYKELQETMTCARAEALGMLPAPNGTFAVRFRFALPCPEPLRHSAISGRTAAHRSAPAPREKRGGDEFAY